MIHPFIDGTKKNAHIILYMYFLLHANAAAGVQGWVDCFERAEFKGKVFAGGVNDRGDVEGHKALDEAYKLGALQYD